MIISIPKFQKTLKEMESSFAYIDTIPSGIDEINNYFHDDYKSGKKVLDAQFY
jgi:hypothetical protein